MTKEQEIEKLEERKLQIDVEIAYLNGAVLEYKHKSWHFFEKYSNDHPTFDWGTFIYRVNEEPKQIPFDGSDAESLVLRKFKHKKKELYRASLDADEKGIVFADEDVSYRDLAEYYLIWNDLLKWQPCTKVG